MSGNLEFYDAFADQYDRYYSALDPARVVAFWLPIIRQMGLPASHARRPRLLDLACGPGTHLKSWQAEGFEVDGLDGSSAMLVRANDRISDCKERPTLFLADVLESRALSSLAAKYELVVAHFNFLNQFSGNELGTVLSNIAALLVSGGVFATDLTSRRGQVAPRRSKERGGYADGKWNLEHVITTTEGHVTRSWRTDQRVIRESLYAHEVDPICEQLTRVGFGSVEVKPFQGNFGSLSEAAPEGLEQHLLVARKR